jgi:EmrB/QacA subfamily drug resistance transporter
MIMPAGMTILTRAAGPQRVGRVMGVIGVPMLIGPILGPILGGWLVDDISWRWIFYVNIPIGAVALVLAARILPADRPQPSERLDVLGLALLSPGLAAFVYGLAETSSQGGLSSAKAVIPLVVGAIMIAGFIAHSLRTKNPLIDVRLFSDGTMRAASLTTCLFAMSFFGAMLLLPLYYQIVRGQSALHAGLLLAPQGVGAMLTMPITGRMTDRTGPGRIVLVGLALVLVGTVAFALVSATTSFWLLGGALFVRGMGMGATMMPAMAAAYQTLSHAAVARATSALNIIQRVGGSIGTAVLAIVLQHQLTSEVPAAAGAGLGAVQTLPARAQAQVSPKLASAFGSTFWWAVAMTALAVIPAVFLPRHRPTDTETTPEPHEATTPEPAAVLGA